MSGFHMLTLSIAEGIPGSAKFEINCIHIARDWKGKMVSFEKTKQEIFTPDGKPIWDLGRITLVENFHRKPDAKRNRIYNTAGEIKLLENKVVTKETLKRVLEENLVPYSAFVEDNTLHYAVVKPRGVISIDQDTSGEKKYRKQRMIVDFDDNHRQEKMLNKDYRWVHYWRQIPDDVIYTKQDMYEKLFNDPGKTLYLIIRKYYFDNQPFPRCWISGMHWL